METQPIQTVVTSLFIATDRRDWVGVRAAFAPQVFLDYTSMQGGKPATLPADQIITNWRAVLPGFAATHHQLGNFQTERLGDYEATAFCYGTATHYLPQPSGGNVWTVVGTYDFHLTWLDATWKVDRMTFHLKYQDGNADLPKVAMERVKNEKR